MYTLLVADDENLERQAIKKIVEIYCPKITTVLEAENGIDALDIYNKQHPDIFFCDIKMPGKTGIEVVREIRRKDKNQIIVFLTAYDYFNYAKEAVSLGVNEYLLKPAENVNVQYLINKMIDELEKRNSEKKENEHKNKRLNLLNDFFKNEYLAAVLDHGDDDGYLTDFQAIFPSELKLCIAAGFEIISEEIKENKEQQSDLFKQRILQIIKAELDKYRYSYFLHERDNKYLLLLYPDVESSAEEILTSTGHFEAIKQVLQKKVGVETKIVLKITENAPASAKKALFEVLEKISTIQSGVVECEQDEEVKNIIENKSDFESESSKRKVSARLGKLMQEIGDKIENEYMSVLTLDEAAASVNLSSFYFSKVFKQYWGRNFVDYLNDVRFKNACYLLVNPKLSIKEVAIQSGYSDANYFSRVFKTMSTMTPSEYRNKNMR